jgi:hypothetical protein
MHLSPDKKTGDDSAVAYILEPPMSDIDVL